MTAIHRDWNARYVWPRFVTALPREFFAAVRADAAERGLWLVPQTRDMNPVYPGKDVSYIDTKQGQRAAEIAVGEAERLATLAWLAGAGYPAESLDKAWRQLVFGAHHDAITGTESDQVYLDLLGGWREAWQRGDEARRDAAAYLAGRADTRPPGREPAGDDSDHGGPRALTVFNTLSWARSGLVRRGAGVHRPRPRLGHRCVITPVRCRSWPRRPGGTRTARSPRSRSPSARRTCPRWATGPTGPPRRRGPGPAARRRLGAAARHGDRERDLPGRGRPGPGRHADPHRGQADRRRAAPPRRREPTSRAATSCSSRRSTTLTRAGARARGCCPPRGPAPARAAPAPRSPRSAARWAPGCSPS